MDDANARRVHAWIDGYIQVRRVVDAPPAPDEPARVSSCDSRPTYPNGLRSFLGLPEPAVTLPKPASRHRTYGANPLSIQVRKRWTLSAGHGP